MLHKPNLENILQNNWPEPFKNVKVKEKLKGLRSYPRVQFTKEVWQPNIMCNPGFEFWFQNGTLMEQLTKFE